MGLFLNTNVASLNAQRNFFNVTAELNKSIERLSTGFKINSAADNPGSLLLANHLESRTRGFAVAESNIQQGSNLLSIADGAMQTIQDDLQRLREIALEASNGTVTDFTAYTEEASQISTNIDAVANGTTYGSTVLLAGGAGTINIQAGAEANATDTIDIGSALSDNTVTGLNGGAFTAPSSQANAQTLLGEVDTALAQLSTNQATLGGMMNQLSNRLEFVQVSKENYAASEALVRNVDVAAETSRLTQLQIVQQASAMALSQANQAPAIALQLLN